MLWDEWKLRYNIPKITECSYAVHRGKLIAENTILKKEKNSNH